MAKFTIGLEPSEKSWKTVVISRGLNDKVRLEGYFSIPGPAFSFSDLFTKDDDDPVHKENLLVFSERLSRALSPFMSQTGSIVIGIPQDLISLRILDLPFTQAGKIEQVLPFEVESSLPFDSEDLVFDYFKLLQTDGHTKVMSAAVKRDQIGGLLDHMKILEIDPTVIAPTTLSFNHLLGLSSLSLPQGSARIAFLNLGDDKAEFCVVEDNRIVSSLILTRGTNYTEADSEEETPPAHLVDPLVHSLEKAIHYLEGFSPVDESCPPALKQIILIGAGACIAGLDDHLTEALGIETVRFQIPDQAMAEDKKVPASLHPELAPALALALQKAIPNGRPGLNFRKEEFAFRPERQALIRRMIFPAFLIMAMIFSVGVNISVSGSSETQQARAVKDEMKRVFTANFPGEAAPDPAKFLGLKLVEAKAKHVKFQDLDYPSAINVIAAISAAIPDTVSVTLSSFEFKGNKVNISGTADKYEAPNEIHKRLAEVSFFKKVELKNVRRRNEEEVHFDIGIDLNKGSKP